MSRLLSYLNTPNNRGIFYWLKYHLSGLFEKKPIPNKKDWVGLKINHSVVPEGWTSENAFEFSGKEYQGIFMKRFKD